MKERELTAIVALCFYSSFVSTLFPSDLRSCQVTVSPKPETGKYICLTLLSRKVNSNVPIQVQALGQGDDPGHNSGSTSAGKTRSEKAGSSFGKLVTTSDPMKTWTTDIRQLGYLAAEIADAGGMEAEINGPFVHIAAESLAQRASAWVERRYTAMERRDALKMSSGPHNSFDPQGEARIASKLISSEFEAAVSTRLNELAQMRKEREAVSLSQQGAGTQSLSFLPVHHQFW